VAPTSLHLPPSHLPPGRDGSAGVDPELEAGAGLGVVAIEDAEVLDVG
jgi:hypothetical protein